MPISQEDFNKLWRAADIEQERLFTPRAYGGPYTIDVQKLEKIEDEILSRSYSPIYFNAIENTYTINATAICLSEIADSGNSFVFLTPGYNRPPRVRLLRKCKQRRRHRRYV